MSGPMTSYFGVRRLRTSTYSAFNGQEGDLNPALRPASQTITRILSDCPPAQIYDLLAMASYGQAEIHTRR